MVTNDELLAEMGKVKTAIEIKIDSRCDEIETRLDTIETRLVGNTPTLG